MKSEPMMSVAEVLELEPGTKDNATWVNPGFIANVGAIKQAQSKSDGQQMNICTLHDTTNPNITISMTVFADSIAFGEGDMIQVCGNGLRRTVYNGLHQVSLGKKSEIQRLKIGSASGRANTQQQAAPKQAEKLRSTGTIETPSRYADGPQEQAAPRMTQGVTVGMAINNAVQILKYNAEVSHPDAKAPIDIPSLQQDIEQVAAILIAASRRLEAGKVEIPELTEDVET